MSDNRLLGYILLKRFLGLSDQEIWVRPSERFVKFMYKIYKRGGGGRLRGQKFGSVLVYDFWTTPL